MSYCFYATADTNPSGDTEQFLDFEIPAGGYLAPPIQKFDSNTRAFGENGNTSKKLTFRVPANAPAAQVSETIDQVLVSWPLNAKDGIIEANLKLSSDYLPNPGTDYFYI